MAYPGGKGRCYRRLINLMPPHRRYIETHLGGGAVMKAKRPAEVNIGIDLDERVVARWSRRTEFEVLQGDAAATLARLAPKIGDLVYSDPPYLAHTRRRRSMYRHDYSDQQHSELLTTLKTLPSFVMVSGYQSDLYNELLQGWTRIDFDAPTQNGIARECVWLNFEAGPILHDYSFIGEDFRDRERVSRRIATLTNKLVQAAPLELNAVLAELAEREPSALLAAAERIR